jgi:ribose 1,5-bisphosphokinase
LQAQSVDLLSRLQDASVVVDAKRTELRLANDGGFAEFPEPYKQPNMSGYGLQEKGRMVKAIISAPYLTAKMFFRTSKMAINFREFSRKEQKNRETKKVSMPVTQIGPGRLVLVVGPSGAGKDTLIDLARAALRGDPSVVFPRRVVTRAAAGEPHDTMDAEAFERAVRGGAFALAWDAHDLRYGIPAEIDSHIRAGRTVVCNVSRTIVDQARARYAQVWVVLVTAPAEVLTARLAARARGSDGDIARRLARADAVADFAADCVIENIGAPEAGAAALASIIAGAAAPRPAAAATRSSASAS